MYYLLLKGLFKGPGENCCVLQAGVCEGYAAQEVVLGEVMKAFVQSIDECQNLGDLLLCTLGLLICFCSRVS